MMTTHDNRLPWVCGASGGFIGGIFALMLLTGYAAPAQDSSHSAAGIVRAQEFQLVDQSGHARALLAFSAEGHPSLTMLDRTGTRIVWLGLSDDSGLAIHDVDGKTRLVLSLDRSGEPSLVVRDRQHKMRPFRLE